MPVILTGIFLLIIRFVVNFSHDLPRVNKDEIITLIKELCNHRSFFYHKVHKGNPLSILGVLSGEIKAPA